MTKLASQFQKAGISTRNSRKAATRKGWNFQAMREYRRHRFDNVTHIGNPVFNHKVEQVVRAVATAEPFEVLNINARNAALSDGVSFDLNELHSIGIYRGDKVQLHPEAVSALATLGLNAGAFLYHLGGCRLVDDLTGQKLEVIVHDKGYIYAPLGVLIQVARDVVFNHEVILANYLASKPEPKRKGRSNAKF